MRTMGSVKSMGLGVIRRRARSSPSACDMSESAPSRASAERDSLSFLHPTRLPQS